MPHRYVVRRIEDEAAYLVWDYERESAAVSDGRECINLTFGEALNLAGIFNAQATLPKKE